LSPALMKEMLSSHVHFIIDPSRNVHHSMRRNFMSSKLRYLRVLALIAVLALIIGTVRSSFAQDTPDRWNPVHRSDRSSGDRQVDPARLEYLRGLQGSYPNLRHPSQESGPVTLLVEFEGSPAAQVYAEKVNSGATPEAAAAATEEAVVDNRAEQLRLRGQLIRLGATELYSVQRVLNASVVRVDVSNINKIAGLRGVKSVSLAPRHSIDNSTSVPFIGGNTVWDTTGGLGTLGLTGSGISIAVIDTGVDYLHFNFNGDADYGSQTDVTSLSDHGFAPSRIIDGWDFVGDAYDASSDSLSISTPFPDADPTDCNGHGSHVAGTAAGNGVNAGAAYTGGYDNLTSGTLAGFDIGPGVAPEADIVALKVFGCEGSTDVVIAAIEYAMDPNGDGNLSDHYDVINMSLGSDYGDAGEAAVIQAAVNAGVIVVTSAGNSGDTHYITGSPGSVTESLSTAASNDDGVFAVSVDVTSPTPASYYAIPAGFGPEITALIPDPAAPFEQPSGNDNGCVAGDFAGFTAGNIALIDRGACNFDQKVQFAQDAGASAAIVVNVSTNVPFVMGGDADGSITIPSAMISDDAGDLLKAALPASGQLNPAGPVQTDILADFSSRGPRRANLGGLLLKPDITAPGSSIESTSTGYDGSAGYPTSGADVLNISGTSMASPHMAGAMALLRELHPTYTVAQLKALVMNSANHAVFDPDLVTGLQDDEFGTSRIGAGRVDLVLATNDSVLAYNKANPAAVSLTFDADVTNGAVITQSQTVTIENKDSGSVTYNLSIQTIDNADGVSFSVSPSSVTIGGNKKKDVVVTVEFDAANMLHTLDEVSFDLQSNEARHWITEETGYLYLDVTAGASTTDLRVPLYAAPRPASEMGAPGTIFAGATTGNVDVPLSGIDVFNSTGATTPSGFSQDYVSVVSAFNLAYTSPKLVSGTTPYDNSDIQYVGVISDFNWPGVTSFFGTSMYGDGDTPTAREVYVCIDLDQDGAGGEFADGTDFCFVTSTQLTASGDGQDVFMTGIWDINGFLGEGEGFFLDGWDYQNSFDGQLDTRIHDNNVMFMPAETSPVFWDAALGGDPYTTGGDPDTDEEFNYYIYTFDFDSPTDAIVDVTPILTFDPAAPVIDHFEAIAGPFGTPVPVSADFDGDEFELFADFSTDADGEADVLLLHHYNKFGSRAEIVTISEDSAPTLDCGIVVNCDMETDADTNGVPEPWVESGTVAGDMLSAGTGYLGSQSYQFSGPKSSTRKLRQDISGLTGLATDTLQLTARVDRETGALAASGKVQIKITIFNNDGSKQKVTLTIPDGTDFSTLVDSLPINVNKAYNKIRVELSVKTSSGTVYFDDVSLVVTP
jgi:subtilisin family serine protease